jgi:type IX secretion system PorP/SprF family membrane protein
MQEKMTFIRYCIALICCFALQKGVAQQAVQYSLVGLNPYQYNVAYAGLSNSLEVSAAARMQWNGIQGYPLSQNINAHLPLYYLHGAFGINIDNEQLGAVRTTAAQISYGYHLPMANQGIFSIGIGGGIVQQSLDGSKLTTPDGKYSNGQIVHNDNFLTDIQQSSIAPTVQFGTYFKNKKLQIGLSANNLTESYEKYTIKNLKIRLIKNIFCNFAVNFEISNSLVLSPVFFF